MHKKGRTGESNYIWHASQPADLRFESRDSGLHRDSGVNFKVDLLCSFQAQYFYFCTREALNES